MAVQVGQHAISILDELGSWLLQTLAELMHREGNIRASGGAHVHEAADSLLQLADQLGVAIPFLCESIRDVLHEVS